MKEQAQQQRPPMSLADKVFSVVFLVLMALGIVATAYGTYFKYAAEAAK